ncbi:Ig-like domain repeat protein [Rudaea sp.]|uniref:Ig-like domain repeat protein n=1 Tax=Rudaea sp. TaxID=2136325 RepID=UPI0037836C3F
MSVDSPAQHRFVLAWRSLLVLALFACAPSFAFALGVLPDSENAALIKLYAQTNGDQWVDHTDWPSLFGPPVTTTNGCSWFGVTCDVTSGPAHVVKLHFVGNNLTGTLPSLDAFTALQEFSDAESSAKAGMTGSLPALNLPALKTFQVTNNPLLTGPIPSLANLPLIESFRVDQNNLTGSLPDLSASTHLTSFVATRNQLTGTIPSLTGLTSLTSFIVSANQLSGRIPALTGLNSLSNFLADDNRLSGSIPSLAGLTSLSFFIADKNQLNGSIPDLSTTTNLQRFSVSNNQLSGSIPTLSSLSSLFNFDASFNQLTGPIPPLSGLPSLQSFVVDANRLSGSIPALGDHLITFSAGNNQLTGNLPRFSVGPGSPGFSGTTFLVPNNQLTGNIPLLNPGLKGLDVSNNLLDGPLPDLNRAPDLADFKAASNRMSGAILAFPTLRQLQVFDIENNQFNGTLPFDLHSMPALQVFKIAGNRFVGVPPIPVLGTNFLAPGQSTICPNGLSRDTATGPNARLDAATGMSPWDQTCRIPDAESDALTALYNSAGGANWRNNPDWLDTTLSNGCGWFGVSCTAVDGVVHVTAIQLGNNNLVGKLSSLDALVGLQVFDVSANPGLGGTLPDLRQLSALVEFHGDQDDFTGPIPALAGHANLTLFNVTNNQLGGGIPPLTGLPALQAFSVANNQLSGPIPDLSGLGSLRGFVVSNNHLSGPIPPLSALSQLIGFAASQNQLTGPLPALPTGIESFDATMNQLSGSVNISALTKLSSFAIGSNRFSGPMPVVTNLSALLTLQIDNNQFSGAVQDPPTSNRLLAGASDLCPNALNLSANSATNTAWNSAVFGNTAPWNRTCNQSMTLTGPATTASGASATYHVAVHALAGATPPAGTVTLQASVESCTSNPNPGQAPICGFNADPQSVNCTLSGIGDADCTVPFAAKGQHHLIAVYSGDTTYAAQTAVLDVSVDTTSLTATTTALTATPSPVSAGGSVTLTATVAGAGGVPTGSVIFLEGGVTPIPSCPNPVALAGTTATCTVNAITAGGHSYRATYSGDANFATSSAAVLVTASESRSVTTTTLSVTPNPATVGQVATVSVTVASGGPAASGTVAVRDGGTVICTVTLNATGAGNCTTTFTTTGVHTLTANYAGDVTHAPSTAAATLTVNVAGQPAVAAPALSVWMLGLLAALLAGAGLRRRRPPQ